LASQSVDAPVPPAGRPRAAGDSCPSSGPASRNAASHAKLAAYDASSFRAEPLDATSSCRCPNDARVAAAAAAEQLSIKPAAAAAAEQLSIKPAAADERLSIKPAAADEQLSIKPAAAAEQLSIKPAAAAEQLSIKPAAAAATATAAAVQPEPSAALSASAGIVTVMTVRRSSMAAAVVDVELI